MGYTSIVGVDGFQLWEASSSPSENALTLLPQFSKDSSPADFPFSAFFEVVETEEDILTLQGSPVLTAKAQKCALGSNNAKISRKDTPRAPYLSVRGTTAKRVARETVCDYSSYIAKLFENFD